MKEIDKETNIPIKLGGRLCSLETFKTAVANNSADDRSVFLLDPRLVVFPIRPAADKLDVVCGAIIANCFFHKDAVIVGTKP